MRKITVDKGELLEILKKNRESHRETFEKAWAAYQKECISQLEKNLEKAKAGKPFKVNIGLIQPEDHTEDYDRAIAMLEMDIEVVVSLDTTEYQTYVDDDWGWKRQFETTNASYGVMS